MSVSALVRGLNMRSEPDGVDRRASGLADLVEHLSNVKVTHVLQTLAAVPSSYLIASPVCRVDDVLPDP
jgi:hypothetical protein